MNKDEYKVELQKLLDYITETSHRFVDQDQIQGLQPIELLGVILQTMHNEYLSMIMGDEIPPPIHNDNEHVPNNYNEPDEYDDLMKGDEIGFELDGVMIKIPKPDKGFNS